jgi:hypothetical protein
MSIRKVSANQARRLRKLGLLCEKGEWGKQK